MIAAVVAAAAAVAVAVAVVVVVVDDELVCDFIIMPDGLWL